jgi:hypothetical protein
VNFGRCGVWPSKNYCFKATSLAPSGSGSLPAITQKRRHAIARTCCAVTDRARHVREKQLPSESRRRHADKAACPPCTPPQLELKTAHSSSSDSGHTGYKNLASSGHCPIPLSARHSMICQRLRSWCFPSQHPSSGRTSLAWLSSPSACL